MNTKRIFFVAVGCFLQLFTIGKAWGQQKKIYTGSSANLLSNTCSLPVSYLFTTSGTATGYHPDSVAGIDSKVTIHYYWGDGSTNTIVKPSLNGNANDAYYFNQQSHDYTQSGKYTAKVVVVAPDSLRDSAAIAVNVTGCKPISGKVYADLNQNCTKDAADILLQGVMLNCRGGAYNNTVFTDVNGQYTFQDVPDNGTSYTMAVINKYGGPPASYVSCPAQVTYTFTTLPATNKDFALKQTAVLVANGASSYSNCVSSVDYNVFLQARTIGYPNNSHFTTHIYFGDGKDTIINYNTMAAYDTLGINIFHHYNGYGKYDLKITLSSTNGPADSLFYPAEVTLTQCGSVDGLVYYDKNNNCAVDSSDVMESNVRVTLYEAVNKANEQSAYTDGNGHYTFNVIDRSKNYVLMLNSNLHIACAGPTYSINSFPATGKNFAVLDSQPDPGNVSGRVYNDRNNNCVFDSNDVVRPNVILSFLDSNANLAATAITDINGYYQFNNLHSRGIVILNNAYQVNCPVGGSYIVNAFPASGKDFALKDTQSHTNSYISGMVFKDHNNNCAYDSNEVLIQTAQVKLLDMNYTLMQTAYTNNNGQYQFNVTTGQSYIVQYNSTTNCTSSYVINSLPAANNDFASRDTTYSGSKGVHAYWYFNNINSCNVNDVFDFYPSLEADGFKSGDNISAKFIYGDGHDTMVNHLVASAYDTIGFHFRHRYGAIGFYTEKFIVSGPGGSSDSAVYVNGVTIGSCGTISGRVYADENANCIFDGNDVPMGNIMLNLLDSNNNVLTYTYSQTSDGSYNFTTPDTRHTYKVVMDSTYSYNVICPAGSSYKINIFPAVNKDFAIKRGVKLTSTSGYPGTSCTIPSTQTISINYATVGYSSGNVTFKIAFGDGRDTTFTQNDSAGNAGYIRYLSVNHGYQMTGNYSVQIILTAPDGATDTLRQYNMFSISDSCAPISGRVFLDANADCIYNGSDVPMQNRCVELLDNGNLVDYAYSDNFGNYYFTAFKNGGHIYKVKFSDYDSAHSYSTCPASGEISISSLPSSGNDFALACTAGYDLAGSVSGWGFKPGYNGYIYISANNKRCTGVNAVIKLVKSPLLTVINSYPAIDATIGDTLVWYRNNFTNTDYFYADIEVMTSAAATLSDSIAGKLILEPIAGDSLPSDNVINYVFPVKNSWDPNMKSSAAANGNTMRMTIPANTKALTYTVFFQNTGNGAAYNIFVLDTLDSSIDPASVAIINQSHKMKADMLPGNILKFNFNNIMLPDSKSNEQASHGFVTYKASLKPGLSKGTIIRNTGYIYFDYNPAIVTNTAQNQLARSLGIENVIAGSVGITAYPNPANDQLTVLLNDDIINGNVSVVDMLGNVVLTQAAKSRQFQLSIAQLPAGIYLLMINKGAFNSKTKISVLHQ